MADADPPSAEQVEFVPVAFKSFLEATHPSVWKLVSDLFVFTQGAPRLWRVNAPDLRLHCANERCSGERTFRHVGGTPQVSEGYSSFHLTYLCGDCRTENKRYALLLGFTSGKTEGVAYKYGEAPLFGVPVPQQLLRLFGKDSSVFLKGRQCENQGLGVGAFAYYRRVVETHKNDIFDAIIRVCQTLSVAPELIAQLQSAKDEISFAKSMDLIKAGLPQGLLINGQNPLTLLHTALSIGLHSETDEQCLETAQAVRIVLSNLVEKMNALRQDDKVLKGAVALLAAKAAK
jgi:hypothetical protein